ncbi:immunoglobulin superfamily member 1-like [Chelonia mydas]|uniref:immunoglobulin superfamily member 1-like n=1 Tax=Chelonia mydas TaxID=8469 RepID=UPI001CA8FD66|nr:immunoglobulin superfamily member 1-like [Chelonia mydas]
MASAPTVLFLGCWLAGHSGAWGEPSYPKPSISLSPSGGVSLGGAVAVWCRGQHWGMQFMLNKEGRHFPAVASSGFEAVFPIINVSWEDRGNYSCSYQNRSGSAAASPPSDPVELVVRDPSLPRPSISLSPTGVTAPGADVTIRCQGQRQDVRFFLHKAGDLNPPRHMDPAGDGAEFHIPTVGRQHGGNYSCSYRPRSEPFNSSDPSDPVQLVVAEPSYPKPNISLSPSWGVSLGGAVAVWCWGQHRGMRFVLNKEGRHFQTVASKGFEAVFPISNVSREDRGSYSCSYHSRSGSAAASSPSDPLALAVRDPSLPRPSISLIPTGVTAPGADVTIRCEGQRRDVRFFLHKAGDLNPPRHMDPAGDGAEFRIPTVVWQHGGNYSCSYRPRSEPFVSSQPSDPVQLVVAKPSYPKPSISLNPSGVVSLGGTVSVWCRGQHQGMRFVLNKEGRHFPPVDPSGFEAVFPISNVRREDRGSYNCSYQSRSKPSARSSPSDPVDLVVRDPSLPRPSISLSPTGITAPGADVTIRCQGQRRDVRFFLHKAGDLNPPRHMDPAGDGAEFRIPTVGWQHGGNYSCSYRLPSEPFVSSQPSDPMQLVVADPSLPRPSISLSPTGVTAPGADVTIRCQGQRRDVRFFLQKAGDLNPPRHKDSAGDGAEFRIPTVGQQDGGNYSCSYRPRSEPFISSDPSDPVELVVAELSYPKPSISLSPSGGVSLGGAVAVWCRGQHRGMRFVLNKEGRHFPPMASKGFEAVFPISNVSREDRGNYNCSYHNRSGSAAASPPSDPVELVVRDPSLPRPSISLSPTGVTAPGADVTIRCQGQRQDVRFFLHKAGDLNPPRHMDPAGDGAEFHIPTVGRQHGGNYSCSYRPRSEPFNSSDPSDPVQLVVAEPSYPKPNISMSPSGGVSLGGTVSVWCRGQHRGMRFVLNKEGRHFPPVDSNGFGAVFFISNVSREHGGSYSCSYHSRSGSAAASSPSDPVELVVRDPSLPRPSISLSPTGVTTPGANVTIRCQGQRRDVRFFLHKAGDRDLPRHMDPAGNGAKFHIPTVGRQHGGSYSCSYRPRSEPFVSSQPSDPVQLVVEEPSYPKPSISLSPSWGVSLGGAVAIWCRGQHRDMQFMLNKEGRHFPPVDPNGLEAVFPISNVRREDGGSYNCSYHSRSEPFAMSSPSDPVELVVRDPSLPRPSISLSPTGVTPPGANVTIRCQGQRRDVRFFLHKAGDLNPPRHMDPAGDGAEFHIPTVGREHRGSYSCSYRPRSEPFVSSQPSHPEQLVVAAVPSGRPDFTHANIARLVLSAVILLVLGLILAETYYSPPREVP